MGAAFSWSTFTPSATTVNRADSRAASTSAHLPLVTADSAVSKFVLAQPSNRTFHTVWCNYPGKGAEKIIVLQTEDAIADGYAQCRCESRRLKGDEHPEREQD